MVNMKLVKERKLSKKQMQKIEQLYCVRDGIEDMMADATDLTKLRILYEVWHDNELLIQRAWGFEGDENFIKFWDLPHCTCPFMDNHDRYPYGHYVVNCSCPVHGS